MRSIVIACILLIPSGVASSASESPSAKALFEAENSLRELTPRLPEMEQEFSNDPEGLLGLASLYERYAVSPALGERSEQLYRKAVTLEPQNKAAFARLALRVLVVFTSRRGRLLEQLEMQRQYALRNNLKEVESLAQGHELFEWLREKEGQSYVVIKDFNEARSRLIQKLDRDLPTVLSILNKGKGLDPDNAVYDYMHASLNFDLGKNEDALLEVERGAEKPRLENYRTQMMSARRKVLLAAGFPNKYREIMEKNELNVGVFVRTDKMFEMAEQYEAKHDLANAKRVYEIMLKAADQLRQESIPGQPGGKRGDNEISRRMEAKAKERLTKIRNEVKEDKTQ